MKNTVTVKSFADLPGALCNAEAAPADPRFKKPVVRRQVILEIEALRLTRSQAGFQLHGSISTEKVRFTGASFYDGEVMRREREVLAKSKLEVSGWGFTVGRAVFAMFRDARRFVPQELKLKYPARTEIAKLLEGCS